MGGERSSTSRRTGPVAVLANVARTAAALRPDAEARARAHLDGLYLAGLGVDPVGVTRA